MRTRLLKMGTVLAAGTMVALLALAPFALATVPPVTQLTAAIGPGTESGDSPTLNVSMVVPDFSPPQDGYGEVLVMISPTRYFSDPTSDLLPGETTTFGCPNAPGPFVCDDGYNLNLTVVEGQSYKFSVFFGIVSIANDESSEQWSPVATTEAVAYLPLPAPTPLKLHSFWLDSEYAPYAYSVHLDPGDVLDLFLSEPRATMVLFPPGTTGIHGQLAQQAKRTLWNEKGAGFVYEVPADGPSGDYILYAAKGDSDRSFNDGWRVDWGVTHGTGRFSIAVPSRKSEHNPQSHVPLQYLCQGTVDPVAAWTGLCWLRVDIYATYGGKTRWWIGYDYGKDALNGIDVRSTGHFTALVRPFENFPGGDVPSTSHAAEKWRGPFKYRFYVESYAGYAGAYSPVYSGTWSGPQYR